MVMSTDEGDRKLRIFDPAPPINDWANLTAVADAVSTTALAANTMNRVLRTQLHLYAKNPALVALRDQLTAPCKTLLDLTLDFHGHRYKLPVDGSEHFETADQGVLWLDAFEQQTRPDQPANRMLSLSGEHRSQYAVETHDMLENLQSIYDIAVEYKKCADASNACPSEVQAYITQYETMLSTLRDVSQKQLNTTILPAPTLIDALGIVSCASPHHLTGSGRGAA